MAVRDARVQADRPFRKNAKDTRASQPAHPRNEIDILRRRMDASVLLVKVAGTSRSCRSRKVVRALILRVLAEIAGTAAADPRRAV
jgi:hypothetical protein